MFDQYFENADFGKKFDQKKSGIQKAFDVTLNVLLVLLLILLAVRLVFKPVIVDGHSMDPTLYTGERVALSRLDRNVKVGDVIVVDVPDLIDGKSTLIIKRVVAVAGDKVAFIYNSEKRIIEFYRNDMTAPVAEEYIAEPMTDPGKFDKVKICLDSEPLTEEKILTIGEGEVFLMGDNRNNSIDSRKRGAIKLSALVGKMSFRISGNPFYSIIFGL